MVTKMSCYYFRVPPAISFCSSWMFVKTIYQFLSDNTGNRQYSGAHWNFIIQTMTSGILVFMPSLLPYWSNTLNQVILPFSFCGDSSDDCPRLMERKVQQQHKQRPLILWGLRDLIVTGEQSFENCKVKRVPTNMRKKEEVVYNM